MLPLLCVLALQTQTAPPAAPPFSTPIAVAETNRLAMTPLLDGKLSPEEWDPLTSNDKVKTYFEWEPGAVYLAAKLPLGQDLVLCMDREADGWLVGRDNLEVRVSLKDGKPAVKARGLDGSGSEGPHWFDVPGWEAALTVAAQGETGAWTFELGLVDPGLGLLPASPGTVALRVDAIPSDSPSTDAYFPRAMTKLNFVMDRSAGLPDGLEWKPEVSHRATVPGDTMRLRQTFKGNNDMKLRRMEMRTEGDSHDFTTSTGVPFPEFDRKNRAFVDYISRVEKGVRLGWFVQRDTLTTGDGVTSVIQSSWRAAPLLDFDLPKQIVTAAPDKRVVRFSLLIRSNSTKRLDGVLQIMPPVDFRVMRGSDRPFIIPQARGVSRKTFELEIPARSTGIYPMIFRADIGGKIIEQKEWLNITQAEKK